MKLSVFDLVGEYGGVTFDDGQRVYEALHPQLAAHESVELDFAGVKIVAAPFLNAAIGQLMRHLTPADVAAHLQVVNLNPVTYAVLDRLIRDSYRYYHDPVYQAAVDSVMEKQAGDWDGF
ncbi:MAG: DUF4325 domain-containing protein [Anaerolineae bacterium]|nr:MAG: DUF4325 domain-containing protein [Anaerolineae bacterium]